MSITAAAHVCMERVITRGYVGTAHKYWRPDLYTKGVGTRGYVGTAHELLPGKFKSSRMLVILVQY